MSGQSSRVGAGMERERRPAPGETLHDGPPSTPRQAATVIVVRGSAQTLEVLLVRRNPDQRSFAGQWVFPGGAVDAADGDPGEDDGAHRAAAVRELSEEAAIGGVDPAELVQFSRWITPAAVTVRFDTRFYLVAAPEGAEPRADGVECVDLRWLGPTAALAAHDAGELPAIFPTLKHLEQLERFGCADDLLAWSRGRDVEAVEPRIVRGEEGTSVVLPGEPRYDEAQAS